MSEIIVRAAEPTDAEALHELYSCPIVIANTLQIPLRSLESQRQRMSPPEPGEYRLVAAVDGRVIGHLALEVNQRPRRNDVARMGMAVHDAFHGQGVGSALMAAMIELADGWLGVRRIELEVWTENVVAVHLYEKFGFVVEGTARQFGRRPGGWLDAFYMARLRKD